MFKLDDVSVLEASSRLATVMVFGGTWKGDPYSSQDIEGWDGIDTENFSAFAETCCVYDELYERIMEVVLTKGDALGALNRIAQECEENGDPCPYLSIYALPRGWLTKKKVKRFISSDE